jgi:hypothetical protein
LLLLLDILKIICCSAISEESDAKPILCRVFWRQVGSRTAIKNDTKATSLRITGLKDGSTYECVIKAGNHLGTSTLTEAVRFTTGDKYITSAASLGMTKNTETLLVCCFFISSSIMLCSQSAKQKQVFQFWAKILVISLFDGWFVSQNGQYYGHSNKLYKNQININDQNCKLVSHRYCVNNK